MAPASRSQRKVLPASGGGRGLLILLTLLICLPELILLLADMGLVGAPRWRLLAYQYGAFWAGLLYGWQPNYAAQPGLMFVTYGFLHTGPLHLLGNMLGLAWLGARIIDRWGRLRFAGIYLAAMLGGAAGFGMLTQSPAPMIGASGAIFGLAAAWMLGEDQDRRRAGLTARARIGPAAGLTLVLAGFNLAIWTLQHGQLAWETHLGGFVAGGVAALVLGRGPGTTGKD